MGIRELRDTLTTTIRRVRAGESIEITHDGEPVAVLAPVPPDRVGRLVAAGDVTAGQPLRRPPRRIPVTGELSANQAIEDDRDSTERRLLYVDSSALVKLVIEEPESAALERHLADEPQLATSRIALVEVPRATMLANPADEAQKETAALLDSCMLIAVGEGLRRAAARLTSRAVRTLDAIHLASALRTDPDGLITYDKRLADAAAKRRFSVLHPGLDDTQADR